MITLIAIGGIWFWLLVAAEIAFLYHCMGLENQKGSYATASLIGILTALFCFSDLKITAVRDWGLSHLVYIGLVAALYVLLGVLWSFLWMWPRYGKKRRIKYKKIVAKWLDGQGIQGDSVPNALKKEWDLVVFGNQDQGLVQHYIKEARHSFQRSLGIGKDRVAELRPDEEGEYALLLVQADPETIGNQYLRRDIVNARQQWLKTQKIKKFEFGDVIPDRLMAKWKERVETPYVERKGEPDWADLATEPLVQHNVGKLATWASWWPVSMLWFFGHDFFHELWLEIIRISTSFLQALMHREFRSVRADFEVSEDQ